MPAARAHCRLRRPLHQLHWGAFSPLYGPVFTDGSALNSGQEGYGSAAFAAVQLRGQHVGAPWVALTGVVPAHAEPTAAAAERYGLAIAALYVEPSSAVDFCARIAKFSISFSSFLRVIELTYRLIAYIIVISI